MSVSLWWWVSSGLCVGFVRVTQDLGEARGPRAIADAECGGAGSGERSTRKVLGGRRDQTRDEPESCVGSVHLRS